MWGLRPAGRTRVAEQPASSRLPPASAGRLFLLSPVRSWARTSVALVMIGALAMGSCRMPGAIRPSVKIGLVAPFEGRYRYIGYDVIYGARLAAREINASGGVGGYSVELVAYDDGADLAAASLCARKFAADDAVVGVVGHFVEGVSDGAVHDYAKAHIPLIAPFPYDAGPRTQTGIVFWLAPPASAVAEAIVDRLRALGLSSAAFLADDAPLASALREEAERRGLRLEPDLAPGSPGYAEAIASAAPDAVVVDALPTVAGQAASDLRAAAWPGWILGGHDLATADFANVAGAAARASCVTPWPLPQELVGGSDFIVRYQDVSGGVPPGRLALPAYEATWLLIEAIQLTIAEEGAPSRNGVARALLTANRTGLLGTIIFGSERQWEEAPLYLCEVHPPERD